MLFACWEEYTTELHSHIGREHDSLGKRRNQARSEPRKFSFSVRELNSHLSVQLHVLQYDAIESREFNSRTEKENLRGSDKPGFFFFQVNHVHGQCASATR